MRLSIAVLAMLSVLGWSLVASASSQAAPRLSPNAGGISVTLSPSAIPADGTSQTTATATGFPALDTVFFTSTDSGEVVGPTTYDLVTGTYNATITSSTTVSTPAAPVTITASDGISSGQGALVQYGPAATVTLGLTPTSIIANGASTTAAAATVTDINGNPVPGQTVVLSSTDPNETITQPSAPTGATGTASGTIQSSTTVGTPTIKATAAGIAGTATLTQTVGPATNVSVTLNPTSIPASGLSTTTATATVIDAQGHPIPNDNVLFASFPAGDSISPTTNNHNGTYTASITSSTTPGTPQIIAFDQSAGNIHGQATLTQTTGPSTTVLSTVPAQPVTNQPVTLIGTVTVSLGAPAGTVKFENDGVAIASCGSVPVAPATTGNSAATATCQTSFAAAGSPLSLTAVFTPSAGNLGGSTNQPPLSLTVGKDSTATQLASLNPNPTTHRMVTYLAAIAPAYGGASQLSGTVQFTDGAKALTSCAAQPITLHGSTPTAVCRVSYSSASTHTITAHYSGDGNFTGSTSSSLQTKVHKPTPPQPLLSTMYWQFGYNPTYTNVLSFISYHVPSGASVQVKCHGHGCPYARRTITVSNAKSCKPTRTLRCTKRTGNTVNLVSAFQHRRLSVGAQIRVEILRPKWIGKYYLFTMRSGHPPHAHLACLAPGSSRPGKGC